MNYAPGPEGRKARFAERIEEKVLRVAKEARWRGEGLLPKPFDLIFRSCIERLQLAMASFVL